MMVRQPYIILHQSEWKILQRKGGQPEEPANVQKAHLKELTVKSQEWIKSWPDTIASHIATIETQRKKQHKDDVAFIKAYTHKLKQENTAAAIKRARQLIFEDSSYGRKLLSALLESTVLDVRDAQIKHKHKLHQKAAEVAKKQEMKMGLSDCRDHDEEREKLNKLKALECNRVNREIIALKKEKELQKKLKEKQCIVEDEMFMMQVLEMEEKRKEELKRCEKEALEMFKADTNELAKVKAQQRKLDEALTEVYKREQDRIKFKTQAVLKRVHQGKSDTKWSKKLYEKIDCIQREEKRRYEDFLNTGIKRFEKRLSKTETKDKIMEKEKSFTRYLISQTNKLAGEEKSAKCENKCACDRQILITKASGKPARKPEIKINEESLAKIETKPTQKSPKIPKYIQNLDEGKKDKLPFLTHRNKLIELRTREKEPSPWSATEGLHVQFAQQADNVLKKIKHKHLARKVVDEYRKLNSLDATTLPVPNY